MASAAAVRAGKVYVELGTRDTNLTAGLRSAQSKISSFASTLKNIGGQLLGGGIAAGVPAFLGVKTFAEFDQSMARVKALIRGIKPEEFNALATEAKRLGAETAYTAKQAADGMAVFALAGLKTNEILAAMEPTLDLTAAGQMEVAQAADIALKVMKGMGIGLNQTREVMDVLGLAMTTANTDLVMLGEAFKFVGPMAKTAGISLQEITAGIQLLSDAGIQGEMAGTTLRGIILSLTSPSVEAANELKRLGVTVNDEKGNFRGLVDIINDLERATARMGTGQKLQSLGVIFPARQAAGAAELVAQGSAKLRQYSDNLKSATGTIGSIAKTQLDTLYGSWLIATSSIEGFALAFGEAVAPMLREIGTVVIGLANSLNVWIQKNPQLAQTLVGVTLSVIGLGGAMIALSTSLVLLKFAFYPFALVLGIYFSKWALLGRQISNVFYIPAVRSWTGQAISAIDRYTESMQNAVYNTGVALLDTFRLVGPAINEALANSDIEGAARVAFLGIRIAWQQVQQGMFAGIGEFFEELKTRMARMFNYLFSSFETGLRSILEVVSFGMADLDIMGAIERGQQRDKNIEDDARRERENRAKAAQDAIDGLKAQVEAERELQRATKATNDSKAAGVRIGNVIGDLIANREQIKKAIEGISPGDLGTEVQGTFSAAALWGMGGKSVAQNLVNVGKQQVDELKGLRDDVKKGGARFN